MGGPLGVAMTGAPKRNEYCKACDGWGERFLSMSLTDPGEKDRWHECSACNGSGLAPPPKRDEQEDEE